MNVLILNHYSRLSPRLEQEVKTLSKSGYTISVLLWARDQTSCPAIEGVARVGKIVLKVPTGTLPLLLSLPLVYLSIVKRLWRCAFDVIHCTHVMLLPVAVFLARVYKTKVIYDAYEFHLQGAAEKLPVSFSFLITLLKKLEQYLLHAVNAVFTIDSASGQLEKYYRSHNDNVSVLYNVPDLNQFLDSNKLQHLDLHYRGKKIVVYVGGLSIAKGALQALQAARFVVEKIPEAFFLFVGMFHGRTESLFWDCVTTNNLMEYLNFITWVPYKDVLHYVGISKVGLALHQPIPTYYLLGKGNGRKLFTYMQFGVPIVGPNFGQVGQVVREEKCGILVDTTDPRQVADAIVYLLEHPEKARAMGRRGERAIQEKYNWELEKGKLLEIYRKLERDVNGDQARA